MQIVPMPWHLMDDVRELYAVCHPNWPTLPENHFFAHPTLIAIEPYPYNVAAYASYSMNITNEGRLDIWLKDTGVAPEARGRGLARALMEKRLEIGREVGAYCAIGMTQPENKAMLGILESFGFDRVRDVPGAYPDADGILYILELR
jgi:GNAT superfamily N-acetyltransferase